MSNCKPISGKLSGVASIVMLTCACSVGPNFVRPTPQTPARWSELALGNGVAVHPLPTLANSTPPSFSQVTEQSVEMRSWWNGFNDPALASLIERAVPSNLDLRAALLRIDEARAQRASAAAAYWPSVTIDAAFTRQRISESTPTGLLFSSAGNLSRPGGAGLSIPNPFNQYQLSAAASWEIDLFGRVRRSVEAADANVQVSVEDQRSVLSAVLADVAQAYLELRGAQARLRVTQENLATLEELLDLTRQRLAAGLTTDIDVSNAAAQAYAARASLPPLGAQITHSLNKLSLLMGREPEALRAELENGTALPAVPPQVPIGLPTELARRRPDIREAEANLHAATALKGVAVANLYPRLTLGASGGFQSETAGNLLKWASRFGSLGPSLDVPIFDRGRWTAVHLYDVRAQESALGYQRTVLNALHEVENALATYSADQQRRNWLIATVDRSRDALALSRLRYANGLSNFIDVLDAERTHQQNELALVDSTTVVTTDLVDLYRALGGGWSS